MPQPTDSTRDQTEAQKLYSALFSGHIPPVLQTRFHAASARLNAAAPPEELAIYYVAIDATDDLESLELASRLSRRLPLLTRKLRAMAYLAETLPDHQRFYVNEQSGFIAAALAIAWEGLRSVIKAAKGFWLLRSVGHA
jgi:hypothetical protein